MGQSNSRRWEPAHPHTPTAESQMSVDSAGPSSGSSRGNSRARYISEGSESRRSSARRSLLNLVRAGNIRRRVNSAISNPGDSRRSWRHSNRWSKMPPEATPSEEPPSSSSSLPVAGPSTVDKGKEPERIFPLDDDEDEEYHEAVEEQLEPIPRSVSMPVAEIVSSGDSPTAPTFEDVEERTEHIRTADLAPTPSQEQLPHSSIEAPQDTSTRPLTSTIPLPPRQFPPPGTLVIVQGVVHTTDISRHNPQPEAGPISDVHDPSHHSRTRERLSSLLRPPRPPSSFQPDSVTLAGAPSEVESPDSSTDIPTSLSERPHTALTTPIVDEPMRSTPESQPPSSTLPEAAPENRLPSISSSSIDVLGTLLSVAAAATAASLLTGSSEPILSSGLAPPPPINTSSPPPPPLPAVFPRMLPDASATSRADRMRQAWSTIRERLGLRPSVAPEAPTLTGDDTFLMPPGGGPNPAPADARELMLAEMARAFNIGLGLNGSGVPSSSDESGPVNGPADTEGLGPSNSEAQPRGQENGANDTPAVAAVNETVPTISMPQEGSFERFLVDLQLDLRVALTHVREETLSQPVPNGHATDGEPEPQPEEQALFTSQPHPSASTNPNMQPSTSNAAAAIIDYALTDEAPSQQVSGPRETADSDTESMPTLPDAQGSDSEGDRDDFDDEDFHSAARTASQGDGQHQEHEDVGQNGTTTSGMGRIDASGRINWWRLYRFPQITSLGLDLGAGLRQVSTPGPSTTTSNSPSAAEPFPLPAMSAQPASGPTSDLGSTPPYEDVRASEPSVPTPPSGTPLAQAPRSVVPVIIVGLQSVHPEMRHDAPPPPPPGENESFELPVEPPNNNSDADFGGSEDDITFAPDAALGRLGGRPRGWQSRAANAIRNLRPGRRNTDAGQAAPSPFPSPSGSRTFLIYVIGGYYPPDHSIVTGGPNNFDSFEALLELADLLGQVKPSTVSKEDIENSGLEVIKASLLPQYYKENRITANCLDRCLVCLEDYQTEDDVRVMKCRHVFHQACVDEWMQRGRNNCPTCRSTGVQSATETPAQTA